MINEFVGWLLMHPPLFGLFTCGLALFSFFVGAKGSNLLMYLSEQYFSK